MIRLTKDLPPDQLKWRNDPQVFATCRQNELISNEDQEMWVRRVRSDPTIQMFGLELVETKTMKIANRLYKQRSVLVGTAGLTNLNRVHRSAEYSLLIGPPYQGKGYAKEGLKALLRYGFLNMGLHRIYGDIMEGNPKSIRIARDLGMVEEGRLRGTYWKSGRWCDSWLYSMLLDEFLVQSWANL